METLFLFDPLAIKIRYGIIVAQDIVFSVILPSTAVKNISKLEVIKRVVFDKPASDCDKVKPN